MRSLAPRYAEGKKTLKTELAHHPIVIANSSGFPLQIATVHAVNQSRNWRVLFEEHHWQSDRTGSEGFIDIVAVTKDRATCAMVMECKRVRQTAWVFLIPKESPSMRSQTTVWHSHRKDSKWTKYDWINLQADPSSYQSQYCAIPGQEQGRRNILERTASELIDSVEAFAEQERLIQEKNGTDHFNCAYIPVVVTTAQLFVSYFDPAAISLTEGSLPTDAPLIPVPNMRFRKSLGTRAFFSSVSSIGELHTVSERTIFVVNSENLPEFMRQFEVN
jgi:hypothetical protein